MSMENKGKTEKPPSIWSGQGLNTFCLLALLVVILLIWTYLDKPYPNLFWIAISFPIVLALADRGSLHLGAFQRISITGLFAVIGIYAIYSVLRYFGLKRAAGADHFDPRYRDMPFVRQGVFRFTSNGMYLYAFLLFWAIAIGLNSSAALAVAAFSHAYIWVHFYSTEKPDMDFIYSSS